MTQVIALKSFSHSITKDKEYSIIREVENNYVVTDDEGYDIGFDKSWFKNKGNQINLDKIANSLVYLCMFPEMDFSLVEEAKEKSKVIVLSAIKESENEKVLDRLNELLILIDQINISNEST